VFILEGRVKSYLLPYLGSRPIAAVAVQSCWAFSRAWKLAGGTKRLTVCGHSRAASSDLPSRPDVRSTMSRRI
jgi:hypothetical protein